MSADWFAAGVSQSFAPAQLVAKIEQRVDKAVDAVDVAKGVAIEFGPKLLGALVIIIIAWMIAGWSRRTLYRVLNRPHIDQTLLRFISNAARWIVLAVALVGALGVLGFPPASVVTVMGAAGLAIGLALQSSLSNLAAGIMLLLLRPFRVGDVINVAGVTGKVDEIELFATKVDTGDYRRVILPNAQIFGQVIDNQTHHRERCLSIVVGVEYAADHELTRAALAKALKSVEGRLATPEPSIRLTNLAPSSVEWTISLWCATTALMDVRERTLIACKIALEEAGIAIPFPQQEVSERPWVPLKPREASQPSRLLPVAAAPASTHLLEES